jgi:Fe-S-cluster containining protein
VAHPERETLVTSKNNGGEPEYENNGASMPGIGVNAIVANADVSIATAVDEEPELQSDKPIPSVPWALFDEIYALPAAPVCMTKGTEKDCTSVCEPGVSDRYSENVFLLPGEDHYLKAKFTAAGVEWKWPHSRSVVVPLGKVCPYYEDRVCTIHDLRPFTCRSYPLRCHKVGAFSLSMFSALGCPFSCKSSNPDPHHSVWLGAWKALQPYIPDKWWVAFERGCPAGFKHLGIVLDSREKGVPVEVLKPFAQKSCPECHGTGISPQARGVCSCIDHRKRKEILRQVGRDANSLFVKEWEK